MVRIRVTGSVPEVERTISLLAKVFNLTGQSNHYPDHKTAGLVRVYVLAERRS